MDELLSLVLACHQILTHPSGFLLSQSFESWDREAQWRRQIRKLRRRGWIESTPGSTSFPYLATPAGQERALGAVNPETWWNRPWDGKWMEFSFDLSIWNQATRLDPMLPRCLWPVDYLGPLAWDARRRLLGL
jgi:hypothetical protein